MRTLKAMRVWAVVFMVENWNENRIDFAGSPLVGFGFRQSSLPTPHLYIPVRA